LFLMGKASLLLLQLTLTDVCVCVCVCGCVWVCVWMCVCVCVCQHVVLIEFSRWACRSHSQLFLTIISLVCLVWSDDLIATNLHTSSPEISTSVNCFVINWKMWSLCSNVSCSALPHCYSIFITDCS